MIIYPTSQFKKSFKKLPIDVQRSARTKDKIFRENPYTPTLKTHKLKGKLSNARFYFFIANGYLIGATLKDVYPYDKVSAISIITLLVVCLLAYLWKFSITSVKTN